MYKLIRLLFIIILYTTNCICFTFNIQINEKIYRNLKIEDKAISDVFHNGKTGNTFLIRNLLSNITLNKEIKNAFINFRQNNNTLHAIYFTNSRLLKIVRASTINLYCNSNIGYSIDKCTRDLSESIWQIHNDNIFERMGYTRYGCYFLSKSNIKEKFEQMRKECGWYWQVGKYYLFKEVRQWCGVPLYRINNTMCIHDLENELKELSNISMKYPNVSWTDNKPDKVEICKKEMYNKNYWYKKLLNYSKQDVVAQMVHDLYHVAVVADKIIQSTDNINELLGSINSIIQNKKAQKHTRTITNIVNKLDDNILFIIQEYWEHKDVVLIRSKANFTLPFTELIRMLKNKNESISTHKKCITLIYNILQALMMHEFEEQRLKRKILYIDDKKENENWKGSKAHRCIITIQGEEQEYYCFDEKSDNGWSIEQDNEGFAQIMHEISHSIQKCDTGTFVQDIKLVAKCICEWLKQHDIIQKTTETIIKSIEQFFTEIFTKKQEISMEEFYAITGVNFFATGNIIVPEYQLVNENYWHIKMKKKPRCSHRTVTQRIDKLIFKFLQSITSTCNNLYSNANLLH